MKKTYITETELRSHIRNKLIQENALLLEGKYSMSWDQAMKIFDPLKLYFSGVLVPNLKKIVKGVFLQIALFAPWKSGKTKRIMVQRYKNDLQKINSEISTSLEKLDELGGGEAKIMKWAMNPGGQVMGLGWNGAKKFHETFLSDESPEEKSDQAAAEDEIDRKTGAVKGLLDKLDQIFLLGAGHNPSGNTLLEGEEPSEQEKIQQLIDDPGFNRKMESIQNGILEIKQQQAEEVLETILGPLEVISVLAASTSVEEFETGVRSNQLAAKAFDAQKIQQLKQGIDQGVAETISNPEKMTEIAKSMGMDPEKGPVDEQKITDNLAKSLFVQSKEELQLEFKNIGDGAIEFAKEILMEDLTEADLTEIRATPAGAEFVKIIQETIKKIEEALTSAF